MERRDQEKQKATKKRGGFKFFSRSSRNLEEEIKKELEEKSRTRKIDVKALEESHKAKSNNNIEKQQNDFRYLLRRTDQPQASKDLKGGEVEQQRGKDDPAKNGPKSGGEQQRTKDELSKSNPRERRKSKEKLGSKWFLKAEGSKKNSHASSQATELTGSWDYIPSPPSSTVDLVADQQDNDDHRHEGGSEPLLFSQERSNPPRELEEEQSWQEYQLSNTEYYGTEKEEEGSDDSMMASSPILNLHHSPVAVEWDEKERIGGGSVIPNEDFLVAFETKF